MDFVVKSIKMRLKKALVVVRSTNESFFSEECGAMGRKRMKERNQE